MVINVIRTQHLVFHGVAFNTVSPTAKVRMLWYLKMSKKLMFSRMVPSKTKIFFVQFMTFQEKQILARVAGIQREKLRIIMHFSEISFTHCYVFYSSSKLLSPFSFSFFLSFFFFFFFFGFHTIAPAKHLLSRTVINCAKIPCM